MNIADSLRPHYVFCTAGFAPFPDTHGYAEYEDTSISYADWSGESIDDEMQSDWRIDDSDFGVRYYAFPRFVSPLPPSRIDVVVPDQTAWSPKTWSVLGARDSVHLSGERLRALGISKHLRRALSHWSSQFPGFERRYRDLPFGSEIVVFNIEADIKKMHIAIQPNQTVWDRMFSVQGLERLWKDDGVQLPPCIDYKRLEYVKQCSSDVCLVDMPGLGGPQKMIFKSNIDVFSALYHEVKVALTLPRSQYIAGPAAYLVTISNEDGSEARVCGFLTEYYELGTLQRNLPERRQNGSLSLQQQVRWARELTSALLHVMSVPGYFYSDLRMDNMVLARNPDGSESLKLIDFDQSRNIYNWVPPEIYYLEWMAELSHEDFDWSHAVEAQSRRKYSTLLDRFLSVKGYTARPQTPPLNYDNPPQGWYFPWLLSNQQEQEASHVYLLGKALYCLFEGLGDADIILGRSLPEEAEQRFPEFRRTPLPIQELVKNCTAGAREWKDGHIKVYRRGGKVFPLGKAGLNGEGEATFDETKTAIKSFWQNEMVKAERFIKAREKYELGEADEKDLKELDYLRRPRLAEVLSTIDTFSSSIR